jgi:predicted anti-sigma-YlaC factor YlaD
VSWASTSMEHERARELFAPLVDEELDLREEVALLGHLAACGTCRQGYEQYATAVSLLRSAKPARPPRDLTKRILKRALRRRFLQILGGQGGRALELAGIPAGALIPILIAVLALLVVALAAP